jgi:hypothetical protein
MCFFSTPNTPAGNTGGAQFRTTLFVPDLFSYCLSLSLQPQFPDQHGIDHPNPNQECVNKPFLTASLIVVDTWAPSFPPDNQTDKAVF